MPHYSERDLLSGKGGVNDTVVVDGKLPCVSSTVRFEPMSKAPEPVQHENGKGKNEHDDLNHELHSGHNYNLNGRPACFSTLTDEIVFLSVVCMAQILTQATVANAIVPLRTIGPGLGVPNDNQGQQQYPWFSASFSLTVCSFRFL